MQKLNRTKGDAPEGAFSEMWPVGIDKRLVALNFRIVATPKLNSVADTGHADWARLIDNLRYLWRPWFALFSDGRAVIRL